jgi:hypothetical protein
MTIEGSRPRRALSCALEGSTIIRTKTYAKPDPHLRPQRKTI